MVSRFLGAQLRPAWRYSRRAMGAHSAQGNSNPLLSSESAARGTQQAHNNRSSSSGKALRQGSCNLLHGFAGTGSDGRESSIVPGLSCVGERVGGLGISSKLWGECWNGGRILLWRQDRCISGRRSTANDRKPANEAIRAKKIMLILERPDGSKESCVLTRKQALEAAQAAKLDLVQVNGKNDPVVCKLMNATQEEYRRKKNARANPSKKQQKKEIRMKGMIADHDLERKVNDVTKHLDRGYVVKVVMEAPTSVLKRSLHCLEELHIKFQELLDPVDVLVKYDAGSNAMCRRELVCSRKRVKEAAPKTTRAPKVGTVPREARMAAPLNGGAIDGVLGVLTRGKGEARLDSENVEAGSEQAESIDNDSEDNDCEEVSESAQEGEGSGEAEVPSLDLEETMMWEMEDSFEKEGGGIAMEWDPSSNRKIEPPKSSSKGGGNRVGKWTLRDGNSRSSSAGSGGDSRRERPAKRNEGGQQRGGRKGGSTTGSARNFPWKGEQRNFPGKVGRGGVSGQGQGKGEGWREHRAASSPSVRSTPYKWTTSDARGSGEVASVLPPLRKLRLDGKPISGVGEAGGCQTGGRGFSERFGGGLEGVKGGVLQQHIVAPRPALSWNAERASGSKDSSAGKRGFPPKVVPPPVSSKPFAESGVKSPGRAPLKKKGED